MKYTIVPLGLQPQTYELTWELVPETVDRHPVVWVVESKTEYFILREKYPSSMGHRVKIVPPSETHDFVFINEPPVVGAADYDYSYEDLGKWERLKQLVVDEIIMPTLYGRERAGLVDVLIEDAAWDLL